MEFTPIASSSQGCCYVVRSGDLPPLLLDCGVTFSEIQKALAHRVSECAACLLTHEHFDHSRSIRHLFRHGVDVYGPAETFRALHANDFRAKAMEPNYVVEIGDWHVQPFRAVHDVPTFGYLIGDRRGHQLLYLTDSAYSPYSFEGLTHIAVECNFSREAMRENTAAGAVHRSRFTRTTMTHMSLETLIDMLKANDLSRVEEIHLLHLSDQNSDELAMVDAVRRATGCPVYVAAKR